MNGRRILLSALIVILLNQEINIDNVNGSSRRRLKQDKEKEKSSKDKKSKDSSDNETAADDDAEDLEKLPLNATVECYRCSSPDCFESSSSSSETIEAITKLKKVTCMTGEICWRGRSGKGGFYRGCASRSCIVSRMDSLKIALNMASKRNHSSPSSSNNNNNNTIYTEVPTFLSNLCCTKPLCNRSSPNIQLNSHYYFSRLHLVVFIFQFLYYFFK